MRNTVSKRALQLFLGGLLLAATQIGANAQTTSSFTGPCPRFAPGSLVPEPPNLFSQNGVLTVSLS
jgi:hypothetical protein